MRAPNLILDRGPCPRRSHELDVALPGCGMSGHFTVELLDAATRRVKQRLAFKNVITNAGLVQFFGNTLTPSALFNHAAVGTSSTAPAVTDTALGAQVGARVTATGGVGDAFGGVTTSPEYAWMRRTREWGTAEGNGNLTEIGLFSAGTGGTMWCRALFRDSSNNPVTVTKTASDVLRVTYEWRLYPPLGDSSYNVTISGTNYAMVARPVGRVTNQGGTADWGIDGSVSQAQGIYNVAQAQLSTQTVLGTRLATPSVATAINASSTTGSFDIATLVQTRQAIWEPAAGANAGASLFLHCFRQSAAMGAGFQVTVTSPFNKTALQRLTLNYTHQWSRVTV